jgi:O-antigen ligase
MGIQALGFVRLSTKPSYSDFSGIIASGGIFEHAEGHAMQMAIGLCCCLYVLLQRKTLLDLICLLLTAAGLIVSQGRGAVFGVVIALALMIAPELFRRSRLVFLGTLLFLWLLPFLIWPQLSRVPGVADYLRLERGLSGRDVAWQFAFQLVAEKPVKGHGFLASSELTDKHRKLLRESGYSGAGTTFHNTFITKAVELGVPATALYSLLYIVPLLRICAPTSHPAQQQLLRNVLLVVITASLFRDYNIGGVRSTALLTSIFIGLANLSPWLNLWDENV